MASPRERSDELNDMLDPHREEEREAAAMALSERLAKKGIEVGSDDDPGQLADLLSGVEEFERAVEAAGGDLFVNTPSSSEPQDAGFVLVEFANPLKLDGAVPELNKFDFAH